MTSSVAVIAPAKVNLYLGVGERRDDGFHEVTTVLQALAFGDTVSVVPAIELRVEMLPALDIPPRDNIAFTAAAAFAEAFSVPASWRIVIEKRIPAGAGLGGGSADAAAVLAALAAMHDLPVADPDLVALARGLGADVAFFLGGGCALFEGRGDVLTDPLPAAQMHVALLKPPASVSTAEAYLEFDRLPAPPGDAGAMVAAVRSGLPAAIAAALENNLAGAASRLVPEVPDALALASASEGVLGANVSGSGSAVFAITETRDDAEALAAEAGERGWWARATTTTDRGVHVIEGQAE